MRFALDEFDHIRKYYIVVNATKTLLYPLKAIMMPLHGFLSRLWACQGLKALPLLMLIPLSKLLFQPLGFLTKCIKHHHAKSPQYGQTVVFNVRHNKLEA